jgi:predicted XRE-type DNA-binding protein
MIDTYADVWDALENSPQKAANLRLRSDLMLEITRSIKNHGWTQAEAAHHCGISQPRINDLLRGKISKFSLDALVNISTAMGQKVKIFVETA